MDEPIVATFYGDRIQVTLWEQDGELCFAVSEQLEGVQIPKHVPCFRARQLDELIASLETVKEELEKLRGDASDQGDE